MNDVVDYPQNPEHLWSIFYDFTQTPRPSKNEVKIREYIINIAKTKNLEFKLDSADNIVIYVPGSADREEEAPLMIQNHVDMVTDAIQGKVFDFNNEPLELKVDNGWLKAKGTTLGADNGIGCAAALAILFEEDISHPPLELLFTADEETGLNGALGLDPSMLKSKRMLNLDTEEWGSFYIGCAGGVGFELERDYELTESTLKKSYKIIAEGFVGGHSGLNIDEQRGNCIKVLSNVLNELKELEIVEFRAGRAHNIIPRDGFVIFNSNLSFEKIQDVLNDLKFQYLGFLPKEDHNFKFTLEEIDTDSACLSSLESKKFLDYLELFPNGVKAMDLLSNKEIVSCSNNLAKVLLVRGKAYTLTSCRFFDRNEVKSLERQIHSLADAFDFNIKKGSEYPSWKPVRENKVLDTLVETYESHFSSKPIITAIHAGLECGIVKDKLGEMDVCSFGPTIEGAHSPEERVEIESVEKFWTLLKKVLKNI